MANERQVGTLLAASLPGEVAGALIEGLGGMWMLDEPAEVVAEDLRLCHPDLGDGEVRVSVRPRQGSSRWRVTVVAADRPGLLAGTAAVLASHGLSVDAAGASTWVARGLALHGVTVEDPGGHVSGAEAWAAIGDEIAAHLRAGTEPATEWKPGGRVKVVSTPVAGGRSVLRVEAPDRIGLLWVIASWLRDHACNLEAAQLSNQGGSAIDTFVVEGTVDADALVTHLAGRRRRLRRSA